MTMRLFLATILPLLTALVTAYTQPDYSKHPLGNAINKPSLNEQVPGGKPFAIIWEPTTQGPITLVLLHGPSTDARPLEIIAQNVSNSGKYEWTPASSLTPDATHYGILLVVEGTGQYQYSTQFGIAMGDDLSAASVIAYSTTVVSDTKTSFSTAAMPISSPRPFQDDAISKEPITTHCTEKSSSVTSALVVITTTSPDNPQSSAFAASSITATSSPGFQGAASRAKLNIGALAGCVLLYLTL